MAVLFVELSTPVSVALFAFMAAIIGPLVTYIAANRKLSGKINTSEAESLWAESASIREDYRSRLDQANQRITDLEVRFSGCERQNIELTLELARKNRIIENLREDNRELLQQISKLKPNN